MFAFLYCYVRIDQIMIAWIMPFILANHDSYCSQYSEEWPFPILAPSMDHYAISTRWGNDEVGSDRFWGGSPRGGDTKADFCFYGRWLQKVLRMRKLYCLSFSPCCVSTHRTQISGAFVGSCSFQTAIHPPERSSAPLVLPFALCNRSLPIL